MILFELLFELDKKICHSKKFDTNNSSALSVDEFEKLCWGHPEIIQLILGVNILDRAEQTERRASAKKKNNGKKELDIENANKLEVLLDDIDRMEVLQLINLAHENNVELIKDQSSEVLRQRLKRVMVDRVV